jgi:hypothetical protein
MARAEFGGAEEDKPGPGRGLPLPCWAMLGRRQRPRARNGTEGAVIDPADDEARYEDEGAGQNDEFEEDAEEADEYEEEYDEETEEDSDETDEYYDEDDEDDEYDEDAGETDEYDEIAELDEEGDGEDDRPEPFTPPTFLEAARQAFRPKRLTPAGTAAGGSEAAATSTTSGRTRAQPATGTDADAKAVNLLDRREQTIGFVLGFGLVALSALAYFADRHYKNKDLVKQAAVRHAAVEVLLIFVLLGVLSLLATIFKRRALVGFFLTFSGLALSQAVGILFGLIYLGGGGWLIFRAMQRSPKSRARQAALAAKADGRAGRVGTGSAAAGRAATTSGTGAGATAPRSSSSPAQRQIGRNNRSAGAAASRGAPSASGRYTPPKQTRRPVPPKQPDTPEPANRLAAWLRK